MAKKGSLKGKRLVSALRKNPKTRNPEALAAWIGRHNHKLKGTNKSEAGKGRKVASPKTTKEKPSKPSETGAKGAKKRIEAQVAKLQKDLPMVEISEVRPMRKDDDIPASSHMGHKAGVIIFNEKKMDAKGIKELKDQQNQGFIVKTDGDPLDYVATHEFGHSVADAVTKGYSDPATFQEYSEAASLLNKAYRSDAKRASFYARTNNKEAFAEAFADYTLNPPEKHSPHTKEVGKVVEALKAIAKKKKR